MVFGFLFNMKPKRRANVSVDEKDRRSFWITAQKMKSPIKDFFSKCDQIRRKLRIWSHLLKKSLMENFIFCAVDIAAKREVTLFSFMNSDMVKPEKHESFSTCISRYPETLHRPRLSTS